MPDMSPASLKSTIGALHESESENGKYVMLRAPVPFEPGQMRPKNSYSRFQVSRQREVDRRATVADNKFNRYHQ